MKKKLLPFLIFVIIILVSSLLIIGEKKTDNFNKELIDNKEYPSDWFVMQRAYPNSKIKIKNYLTALDNAVQFQKVNRTNDIIWEFAGPTNIGGRITDIEITQNIPNQIIYLAAASGGILKSQDDGENWENIFKNQATISIGDIAIDPNNEDVLYAGTGEANASSYSFFGSGIYKSTDAGVNWQQSGLEESAYIGRIIVDYNNSDRIFVAACGNLFTKSNNRGIYRSTDAGENWEQILFVSDTTAAMDIVQHPTNQNVLYATMWERTRSLTQRRSFGETSGIWKSTDGGDNWIELTNGLPTGSNVGRIGIDIAKSNPEILYAFYDNEEGSAVYKTTNGGENWTQTNDGSLQSISNGYGWYFGQIRIDPTNENIAYTMGMLMFKTTDGGASWQETGSEMHVDHHAMEFDETTGKIFQGNDGGFYTSEDGNSWTKTNNVPLVQFYDIAVDSLNPQRLYGGTQDNNSIRTSTGNIDDWEALLGGDGMFTLVDYTDSDIFYCEYQWGGLYRFDNGSSDYIANDFSGDRTNWSTPYVLHPQNSDILYLGTYKIYKTTNKGDSWTAISNDLTTGGSSSFSTITTIDISKINPNIIVAGTADGKVHLTTDDNNWINISNGLPNRWITRVKTDPFDSDKIYATLSGFRWDENISHVYMSPDLGQTWFDISGDLPEIPVNSMILDPDVENRIIVGTDAGIYMTEDAGINWYSISYELPNVPVTSMEFHHAIRTLFVGTYGVSAYKAEIPLDNVFTNMNDEKEDKVSLNIFPNPYVSCFSDLKIEFNLQESQKGIIEIYDIKGSLIYSKNSYFKNGKNTVTINEVNLSKGLFICKLKIDNFEISDKIIVL